MQETITNLGVYTTTMTNGDNHSLINLATSNAKTVIDSVDEMDRMKALIETLEKEIEVMKDDANKVNDNAPEILTEDVVVTKFTDLNNADSEVRRRTGFQNLDHLLAYTILLCNGDFEKMLDKKTRLTWFEEWIFFFEYEWGRTIGRWWDAEAAMKIGRQRLMIIFQNKLDMSKTCRDSWPRYSSFDEYFCLMKEKWKEKYEGERVVMWDDTNVNLSFQPNGADEQRLTYSMYYNANCAKGGVFLQLCGWTGVEHLWVGATSDSHYQEHTHIFEKQHSFAKNDLNNGKYIAFTNIFDKGYRVNLPAWRAGRQLVRQPIFKKSDKKFTGRETIHSASIATD